MSINLKFRLDPEAEVEFFRRHKKRIEIAAWLGNAGAAALRDIVAAARLDPTEQNIANMTVAIAEYRRSLMN